MSSNGECTNDMVPHMDDRARSVQLSRAGRAGLLGFLVGALPLGIICSELLIRLCEASSDYSR